MIITNLFEQLIKRQHLSGEQMRAVMQACMHGDFTDVQIATFLALLRAKGETVEELTAATETMLQLARRIDLGTNLVDIVGTGGDGKNTFNVSTLSSFVVAAAGVKVAKHGNRSVSSRSGSADLLTHAGFVIGLTDQQLQTCMQQCNISFLFAPYFHRTMQLVRPARQQMGIRTLFNLLGPLINPAQVKKQVVGVFAKSWLKPLAQVLANLGSTHALVIHARDGLDEISIAAITDVVEYQDGQFKQWCINPADYGCLHARIDEIIVNSPQQSLALAHRVLAGESGPARDMVLLNSAAALYCADQVADIATGITQAAQAIDNGVAARLFSQLKTLTQSLK